VYTTEQEQRKKGMLYGSIVAIFVVADIVTKYIVESTMDLYRPIPVLGDFFRLTFIYNRGAAFGLSFGPFSRYIFLALTVAAVVMLYVWFRSTPLHDRLRLVAIAMVTGGAIGNLIDRVRHEFGVVDFLDFGIGSLRWPVFNVADIGVTVGALLLAISLWKEEAEAGRNAD
jgi:signal peptidase II